MPNMLGKRLKSLRERKGIAQNFVAEKIGIKNNTLSGYESGRREPDVETLSKLAKFYEVTTDYLLGRSNDPALSSNTENLIHDIDITIDISEMLEKYDLKFEGKSLNEEDKEKILSVIKTLLSMKK